MSSASTVYSLIQLGRFVNETINLYSRGDLSNEELEARWEVVRMRIDSAEDLWNRAVEKREARK